MARSGTALSRLPERCSTPHDLTDTDTGTDLDTDTDTDTVPAPACTTGVQTWATPN